MGDFDGKQVLVVGGSSGIGLAAAQRILSQGATVTIASRSRDKVDQALARLGGKASGDVLDTTDDRAVEAYFRGKTFDHVVSSASQTRVKHIKEMPLEDAYASMNSKFWGFFRIARAASIAPGGSLTIVTGFRSIRPAKGNALQGAINAGLEGLVRGLALELAPVRVNAVSPGFTNTPLLGPLSDAERQAKLDQVAAAVPAGVAGQPEHMAIQITACMLNPYMTGSTVYIEGGAALA